MTKNEVAMCVCVCARHGRGGQGSGGMKDLGTDEFTSLSKWNDIVVNLGATKNNNNEAANEPTNERTNVGQDKTNSIHDGDKEAKRRAVFASRGRGWGERRGCKATEKVDNERDNARLHNNKAKQQQIACPSALDATQYTHSYLLLSGSRCNVKGSVGRGEWLWKGEEVSGYRGKAPLAPLASAALMKTVSELTVLPTMQFVRQSRQLPPYACHTACHYLPAPLLALFHHSPCPYPAPFPLKNAAGLVNWILCWALLDSCLVRGLCAAAAIWMRLRQVGRQEIKSKGS